MINFIIDEKKPRYQNLIHKLLIAKPIKYHIYFMDSNPKEFLKSDPLIGKKIYILDATVNKSNMELAKKIRLNGDWSSSIILINDHKENNQFLFLTIIPSDNLEKELEATLKLALEIQNQKESFHFMYDNEYYQIPFQDIYYFEKKLNDNYVAIVTKKQIFTIKDSIKHLNTKLQNYTTFFQSHQSCIINLNLIQKVDFSSNTIYFPDHKINLLSRNKKKELKAILMDDLFF